MIFAKLGIYALKNPYMPNNDLTSLTFLGGFNSIASMFFLAGLCFVIFDSET